MIKTVHQLWHAVQWSWPKGEVKLIDPGPNDARARPQQLHIEEATKILFGSVSQEIFRWSRRRLCGTHFPAIRVVKSEKKKV